MTSKDPKKTIDKLENQKVDSDKITGGGKEVDQDMRWSIKKNKFSAEAGREQHHNPGNEKAGRKGTVRSSNNPLEKRN